MEASTNRNLKPQRRRPQLPHPGGRTGTFRQLMQSQWKKDGRQQRAESGQPNAGNRKLGADGRLQRHDALRVWILGGQEEVGRNMTVVEHGKDIILIDMGLQFPEEDMPGIDYIIPNIESLRGKERNIRGVFITHGHYDHIGAIPHLMAQLGNPVIYGTPLTLGIIEKRQSDFDAPKLKLHPLKDGDKLRMGSMAVEIFLVSHNIPGSIGYIIETPNAKIVHTGDFKIDLQPSGDKPANIARIAKLHDEGVTALFSDSTNATQPGRQLTETEIKVDLEKIIMTAKGRLIIGTFASNLGRLQQLVWLAEKHQRKVFIEGYSMRTNIEIAQQLGYMQAQKGTILSSQDMHKYPDRAVMLLCTGAQGEGRAALMRIANREHRFLRIQPGDTVVFSSSVVPGNERSVQRLTDSLYREGADVFNYTMMDIHAGGHAKQEDLKLMLKLVNPKYLVPIEGNHAFLHHHKKTAVSVGFPEKNVFIVDNGQIIEFVKGVGRVTNKRVNTDYVFVDGLGVGDVSSVVLRDRQQMAADGMLMVVASIDGKTGRLVNEPDIISRGFVYMKESQRLIRETQERVKKILVDREPRMRADDTLIKNKLRDDLGAFLFQKTERRPLILPVIIKV